MLPMLSMGASEKVFFITEGQRSRLVEANKPVITTVNEGGGGGGWRGTISNS